MIDVFQTPLPVSSSELKARRNQYRFHPDPNSLNPMTVTIAI
jgi:hypothetical protein